MRKGVALKTGEGQLPMKVVGAIRLAEIALEISCPGNYCCVLYGTKTTFFVLLSSGPPVQDTRNRMFFLNTKKHFFLLWVFGATPTRRIEVTSFTRLLLRINH